VVRSRLESRDHGFADEGHGRLAFLKELRADGAVTVIVLTSHGTIAEAVQATQGGAFGYLVKPVGKERAVGTSGAGDGRLDVVR